MKSVHELNALDNVSGYEIRRILDLERFLQMINEDSLTLVSPEKWQDPYEKALQKHYETNGVLQNGGKVFGLCWSTESRSDALWRIYSPNQLGIQVSTTVGKLSSALDFGLGLEVLPTRTFIGRVSYLPETVNSRSPYPWRADPRGFGLGSGDFSSPIKKFSDALSEITRFARDGAQADSQKIARAFLIKRRAFQHESEIRLLCLPTQAEQVLLQTVPNYENSLLKIKAPMEQLITRIEFDPRMGDHLHGLLTEFVKAKLPHLRKSNIKRSTIYKIPNLAHVT